MKQLEKQIEKSILQYLDMKGFFAFKVNTLGVYDPVKKVFRKPKGKYNINGISDIIANGVINGHAIVIYVEVKSKQGRLSDAQKIFRDSIYAQCGHYIVARSIDDVSSYIDTLKNQTSAALKDTM